MIPNRRILARLGGLLVAAELLFFVVYVSGYTLLINFSGDGTESWMIDFTAFWGAGKLAVAGEPLAAFDMDRLAAVQGVHESFGPVTMPWRYPPTFHMVVAPLGLLPFSVAFLLFSLLSVGAFYVATRPLDPALPAGLTLLIGAPAAYLGILIGNNSLLSAACLTGALVALGQGRQRSAGLLIALLTMKPSLGILIPPVLLAARRWATIGWATAGAVALAGVATVVFGLDYWDRFLDQLALAGNEVAAGISPRQRMVTWYAFARSAGLDHATGLAAQGVALIGVVAGAAAVWVRRDLPFAPKAAVLCLGMVLATPYAFYYETLTVLVGIAFLLSWRDDWPWPVWAVFAAIWLLPFGVATQRIVEIALYAAPLLTAAFSVAVHAALRHERPPA